MKKHTWLKRGLSLCLAAALSVSVTAASAFAAPAADGTSAGIVYTADAESLNTLLNECRALKDTDYTARSWTDFQTAVRTGELTAAKENPTAEELDSAVNGINTAKGNLVEAQGAEKWNNLYAKAKNLEACDYTKESWDAFETVWNSVKKNENISTMPEFLQNSMIGRLDKAMDALVEKPVLKGDPNKLADGKYTLKAEMYKASNPNAFSMANGAINHNVWLEVKDGEYYLTLQFMGMAIYNKFGYLKDLEYYEAGYQIGIGGDIEGTKTPAAVLSTQKESDGSDVVDEYNKPGDPYPEMVKIRLVEKAAGQFVPLRVFVPVMDGIAHGLGTQNVLMELDWSKLRTDDGSVQKKKPPVQSPAFDAVDPDTSVKVHTEKGVLEEGTVFVADELTEGDLYNYAKENLLRDGEVFRLYDVSFADPTGKRIEPNGKITFSFPVPKGMNPEKIMLYRINDEEDNIGPKTLMQSIEIKDNYITVTTMHKSDKIFHYAIVEKGSKLSVPGDFTALNKAISDAEALLASNQYTEASAKALSDAAAEAKALPETAEQPAVDAAAAKIAAAVRALELKNADYGKVEAALESVPEDLSAYTEETAEAVRNAVNAVEYGKKISEQAAVDAMAEAVSAAVEALKLKEVPAPDVPGGEEADPEVPGRPDAGETETETPDTDTNTNTDTEAPDTGDTGSMVLFLLLTASAVVLSVSSYSSQSLKKRMVKNK